MYRWSVDDEDLGLERKAHIPRLQSGCPITLRRLDHTVTWTCLFILCIKKKKRIVQKLIYKYFMCAILSLVLHEPDGLKGLGELFKTPWNVKTKTSLFLFSLLFFITFWLWFNLSLKNYNTWEIVDFLINFLK